VRCAIYYDSGVSRSQASPLVRMYFSCFGSKQGRGKTALWEALGRPSGPQRVGRWRALVHLSIERLLWFYC
jgi:hypothetical protein